MYRITVASKVGDYIKNSTGIIYKITGISINIAFNEQTGRDEVRLLFEAVDAKELNGNFFIINGYMVSPATNEEVDRYVLGELESGLLNDKNKSFTKDLFNDNLEESMNNKQSNDISSDNWTLENENNPYNKPFPEVKTIDELLDEYLDYQNLIEVLGDKDGKYKDKLIELEVKLKKMSGTKGYLT